MHKQWNLPKENKNRRVDHRLVADLFRLPVTMRSRALHLHVGPFEFTKDVTLRLVLKIQENPSCSRHHSVRFNWLIAVFRKMFLLKPISDSFSDEIHNSLDQNLNPVIPSIKNGLVRR